METMQNQEQVFCRKQDKNVSKDGCRRCEFYVAEDHYNLFHKCGLEEQRFEALYRIYKQQKRGVKANG